MSGTVHPLFPRRAPQEVRRAPAPSQPGVEGDDALIERVARGDVAAHRLIFERYHARVAAFLRRRLTDAGLCEEVVSDVFFEVWRSAAAYRGESAVASWIFGIAHFKALSARRALAQGKRAAVVHVADDVIARATDGRGDDSLAARAEVRQLLQALQALPAGQRDVVKLAFLEERSYQEIADALGISEANVKTRVNRARARLRVLMGRERGDLTARERGDT
jgi:RNA polymerase sigma-70 factor (ECF subfamily)